MIAKLKPMADILRDPFITQVPKNNHYWKFYYSDKPALGFRDFYLKYWKGDRLVSVGPKHDRKKNIIPDKFEVYGKRGNYVFTAYSSWFEYIGIDGLINKTHDVPIPQPKAREIARKRALPNLPWDDLFEI